MIATNWADRYQFLELLVHCPVGDALQDCPFSDIRKMSLADRQEFLKHVSNDTIKAYLAYHKKCLRRRKMV